MAFIYNSMCQSKGLYAIELLNTNNKTQDALNLVQNFLIRYAMGLCKFNRISYILKILKIFDIKKIIFIKTINQIVLLHNNEFTRSLFITLYNCTYKENSNSFIAKIKKIKLKIFNDYIPIEFQNDLTTNNLRKIKKIFSRI